ncbi:MAG: hypothetical protein V7709_19715 [Halioglobus sp.]
MRIEGEGEGVGMVRHLDIPGIGKMAERMDQCDMQSQSLGYTLVCGNPAHTTQWRSRKRMDIQNQWIPTAEILSVEN